MSAPRIFGTKPHPRVILLGLGADLSSALESVFSEPVGAGDLNEVHVSEFDAVVSFQGVPWGSPAHFFYLCIGGTDFERDNDPHDPSDRYYVPYAVGRHLVTRAKHLEIPGGLDPAIARLVESDLIPKAIAATENAHITRSYQNPSNQLPSTLTPFLRSTTGEVLAGSFVRAGGVSDCWILPEFADPLRWAALARQEWGKRAPDRFPVSDWRTDSRWQTNAERIALARELEIASERDRLLADLDRLGLEAAAETASARASAEEGPRRLLTAQGAPLVVAVASALRSLGFEVRDMDEVFPVGDRREDLRVTSPQDDPSWEVVVEVRGYVSGAKVRDLQRAERWARLYERQERRPPSAVWYVVNQFAGADPADRPAALSGNPEDVAVFSEDDGAVIDTVLLFRLLVLVGGGDLSASDARILLIQARGSFSLDAAAPGATPV